MVTSRATRITLVTRYLIGRLTCERHEREFCTRPFKITELEKGRWSWISNCSEAFHTDSWLAEANPGHSDRDAILQALLPGPRYGSTLGPGKARMVTSKEHRVFTVHRIRLEYIQHIWVWLLLVRNSLCKQPQDIIFVTNSKYRAVTKSKYMEGARNNRSEQGCDRNYGNYWGWTMNKIRVFWSTNQVTVITIYSVHADLY